MIQLQTPISGVSEIEVVGAERTQESWELDLKLGIAVLHITIKSQPPNRRVKRNEDGTSKADEGGALEIEEIPQPDIVDILRSDYIGIETVEVDGILELFDLIESEEGVEAALIQSGIIPES
jgi:hypothetical protein